MNRNRYSLEYVFSISSVPNIFIDLVRDFFLKQTKLIGLMAVQEDWTTFYKYLRLLCKEFGGIMQNEPKLVKLNAPAIVIGDIQGSLNDLLMIERYFFMSFPVIPENLVFLGKQTATANYHKVDQHNSATKNFCFNKGNYSGDKPYGVECLIYLFALKLCAPNKVWLLRGSNEVNEKSSTLQAECLKKYGSTYGKHINAIFNDLFAKLPVAVIVDETIVCLHSGLPITGRISRLQKLPKEIHVGAQEAPIVNEASKTIQSHKSDTDYGK